jgi:hypothetical protein
LIRGIKIEIGGMPILVRTGDSAFSRMLMGRYGRFVNECGSPVFELDTDVVPAGKASDDEDDLRVRFEAGCCILERGDFRAECDLKRRRGRIRLAATPWAIDAVLRILHSLLLAQQGGLLVHAASAVRNGSAFLFAGISGAGKTTISRLAPADATLLTDEISYVRDGLAWGTPFSGELAEPGANTQAPLKAIYLLSKGPENRIEPVSAAEAVRVLLECILFFAHDGELVGKVFDSACELAARVPVRRLFFVPDARVWDLVC